MTGSNLMHYAVRYQKTITDNTFEIISIFQNSSNEVLQQSLGQCSWLPVQSTQGYSQWVNCCLSATDDLKKVIDGCYEQFEQQLSSVEVKNAEPAVKQTTEAPSKDKAVATRKASAAKKQATAAPTTGKSRAPKNPASTGTAKRKDTPETATRRDRKKIVTKTASVTKESAVKEKKSPVNSSSTTASADVKKKVTKASKPIKEVASIITKSPADNKVKATTPSVIEKKNSSAGSAPEGTVSSKKGSNLKSS